MCQGYEPNALIHEIYNLYLKILKHNCLRSYEIYRTPEEYEKHFTGYEIIKTDLLLDATIGSRNETNAKYWFLKKG